MTKCPECITIEETDELRFEQRNAHPLCTASVTRETVAYAPFSHPSSIGKILSILAEERQQAKSKSGR